jgi:hypothetical protein
VTRGSGYWIARSESGGGTGRDSTRVSRMGSLVFLAPSLRKELDWEWAGVRAEVGEYAGASPPLPFWQWPCAGLRGSLHLGMLRVLWAHRWRWSSAWCDGWGCADCSRSEGCAAGAGRLDFPVEGPSRHFRHPCY